MSSMDGAIGIIFLSQIIFGILGNFCLLYHYTFLHLTDYRVRYTDLILRHLFVANFLVILSKGVPQTIAAFGWKYFLSDFECKLLFYVQRVARGVSIESTCLLSTFQAITIGPRNSRWARLKVKAPKYAGFSTILCWTLNMLINTIFPLYVSGKWINRNITMKRDYGYCHAVFRDKITDSLFAALVLFPDILCLGLILWASSSMIFILHRHKQQVQHIHRTNASHRSSPESRATQSILVLVSTFVFFYTLSSIFQVHLTLFNNPSRLMVNISELLSGCFPTLSPFFFMSCDSSVSKLCFAWIRNTKYPNLIRYMKVVCAFTKISC
ncbi:vomeronasal type-1 receptor 4-like [Cynocephalus volans]|uniref:vomeronasal type-1 receptor 4-like n=1 Tax=Cynocephalus volans TaxID=110931 RepID=UPI002FC95AB5